MPDVISGGGAGELCLSVIVSPSVFRNREQFVFADLWSPLLLLGQMTPSFQRFIYSRLEEAGGARIFRNTSIEGRALSIGSAITGRQTRLSETPCVSISSFEYTPCDEVYQIEECGLRWKEIRTIERNMQMRYINMVIRSAGNCLKVR